MTRQISARRRPPRLWRAICAKMAMVFAFAASPAGAGMSPAQSNFILHCGGCHGVDGAGNAEAVPDLRRQVGFFLYLPEGRAYLARLPNVAFSTLNDQELADMLNFMVFTLGDGSAPTGAKPYQAAEVKSLRSASLIGTPLRAYRAQLINRLIQDYGAAETLRDYGRNNYGTGQ